ncbi:MAG: helix-turn-helix transcriptional regulator [Hydrogenophaga sp.]|uniref:helix-turn-helix transcriptional regulator n=1 Tax=unclassified Hydrogenophaga TaxID=2610897 RepID=UPI00257DA5FC|nr:helix-turn-helix transcriptional regulator [Hydrogenophaga sp.]MBL0944394.1 helix-turn-helix transcriptional regulator [Hydrogenophaga sp.]
MWQATDKIRTTHTGFPAETRTLSEAHLLRVFDEIDYGMLLLDAQGRILHANHLARHELAQRRLLRACSGSLLGTTPEHSERIQQALDAALRGQRRLVLMREQERDLSLAFTPLSHPLEDDAPTVLVVMSRQNVCDNLAVRMFARALALSPTEEVVLLALCRGLDINEIAAENGVAVSTIRSQIKTLREKAGASSIRRLLQRINSLPPVVPALRIVTPVTHNPAGYSHP